MGDSETHQMYFLKRLCAFSYHVYIYVVLGSLVCTCKGA